MLRPQRTRAPAARILTLEEVKEQCRIDAADSAEDSLLAAMMLAAEARLDGYSGLIGRCLIDQEWTVAFGCWPGVLLELPLHDVSAVSVSYFDDKNTLQILPDAQYLLQQGLCGPFMEWMDDFSAPSLFDRADAVRVKMTCGFGASPDDVPGDLRHAARLLVAGWYQNRESVIVGASVQELPIPHDVLWLLSSYRRSFL